MTEIVRILSVNCAIATATELHGHRVHVEGLFNYEYEDIAIYHWPKAEQKPGFAESRIPILVRYGGAFSFSHVDLARLACKRVVVFGELQKMSNPEDFMPFEPVQLIATRLESLKQWQRHHERI